MSERGVERVSSGALPQSLDPDQHRQLQRLQVLLEQLDMHIARLGLLLGLALDTHEGQWQALHGGAAPAQAAGRSHTEPLYAQLRGLLVLRYHLVARCAEEVGPAMTWQLILDAEQHLAACGFKPGADGIGLDLAHTFT
jgi:predicted nucleic acid-binding Zn ribbon protein